MIPRCGVLPGPGRSSLNPKVVSMYDVVVIGAGHAGIEAALAVARLGCRCVLVTLRRDTVARMSCNPSIGGLAKGQIVREIDALGGEMGRAIDATGIQFRFLNTGKGPAVRALRAQADAEAYSRYMDSVLEGQENLTLCIGSVQSIQTRKDRFTSVMLKDGSQIQARAAIVTAGTFLNGLIHIGFEQSQGGRVSEPPSRALSDSLAGLGLTRGRLKTGTPARLDRDSIRYEGLQVQPGDMPPSPFSHFTRDFDPPHVPCHITHTTEATHDIIRENLDRSPLYSGIIEGIGPRYCPSIEDKVVKFPDRTSHHIYLEPEGVHTNRVYPNGISTSLPKDVQEKIIHSIPGLEAARILQWAYAIEYDFFPPIQIQPSFETKAVEGLYLAGQICGTSGYEEAAGQGLLAGINAVRKIRGQAPFVLDRGQAYLGVLVDDLCILSPEEPYRMFTSSAEYRLLLRHDNADVRLMPLGVSLGLLPESAGEAIKKKAAQMGKAMERLADSWSNGKTLLSLLRRQNMTIKNLCEQAPWLAELSDPVLSAIEIEGKYGGYIERQLAEVERMRRWEKKKLPPDFDYAALTAMRREAREKLARVKPVSVAQARRIAGVRPADIAVLMVHLKSGKAPGRNSE